MTKTIKLAGGLALAFALLSQPLAAQSRKPAATAPAAAAQSATPRGQLAPGIAIADLDAAIASSNAYRSGVQQAQQYYKPTIDAAQAKLDQYNAQLKVKVDQLKADAAAKKPDAVLQQEYADIKKMESQRDEEVNQLIQPYVFAESYIREQIESKIGQAVQNAAAKRGFTILLRPETVYIAAPAYDVTAAIVQELNTLLPSVQIVPPAGWVPREMRQQQQQQQGQPQATQPAASAVPPRPATTAPITTQPAPRPAGPQPEGR